MAEYLATGRATFDGVVFYIEAATEAEARDKARMGKYVSWDMMTAQSTDWAINPDTVEENT
jgi:hypothetical protein